jgi:hypothetical protein
LILLVGTRFAMRAAMRRTLLSVFLAMTVAGCDDRQTALHDPNEVDGGGSGGGGGDGGSSGGGGGTEAGSPHADAAIDGEAGAPSHVGPNACNNLAQLGSGVDVMFSTQPVPAALGGTVADGTYRLISETLFGQSTDQDLGSRGDPSTLVIAGATAQEIISTDNGDVRSTSALTVQGTAFKQQQTCIAGHQPSSVDYTYTATQSSLTLYLQKIALHYEK